jgi:heat shock protein HtpX
MYTVNPFREKGRAAADLTSTHPPISQRVKILRAMSGASPADYEQAYENIKGGRSIVPASALTGAGAVALRAASAEKQAEMGDIERTRETSDMLYRMGNYRTVDCNCGARIKVPPSIKDPAIKCPRCGRLNRL